MAGTMKRITAASAFLSLMILGVYYLHPSAGWLAAFITCFTTFYHFLMRLITGLLFNRILKNQVDLSHKWYQIRPIEHRLYQWMRVKHWKQHAPSYDPDLFDPRLHTWKEIAMAMCQAELVHETIVILSFVPLLFSLWWDAFPIFLITSFCAALVDTVFVIIQRYNRPRILRLLQKHHS